MRRSELAGKATSKKEVREASARSPRARSQRPERLLMVDYQQRASDDEELPALADVFAAWRLEARPAGGGRGGLATRCVRGRCR